MWNPAGDSLMTIEWSHNLDSIVTAVAQAGLRISHLLEMGDAKEKYNLPGYPKEFHLRATKE